MRKFIMSLTTVATLSLAAVPVLGLTQAANAGEREQSVTISFGDLNLADPSQAAVFKARVDNAGQDLCRAMQRSDQGLDMTVGACVAKVRREAANQLSTHQRKALTYAARAQAVEVAVK
ncbi:UrcA family protein [Caulobacter sp. BE264]|jgi:UrcA family protein|uniref:UrcA family protein n=1 Tax=Caulobacter sp. BE264 TaxID=2817724 RepID=UPI00285696C8|nr:UrcA family protein [Caulobacter sp. BE264]MDR7231312.1 UrcA family protein [Caulobacter sp. BE264]